MGDLEIDPVPDPAVRMPRWRRGRWPMIVIAVAAASLVAVAVPVVWSMLAPPPSDPSDPAFYAKPTRAKLPDEKPPAPPEGLRSSDPAPNRGLWCAFVGGVPVCAEGLAACERGRGGLAVPASPCERTTPSCFITRGQAGEIRICTPTLDGCEQTRTGGIAQADEILTGCLPSTDDVEPDDRNWLVSATPPKQWCTGVDCTTSEYGCSVLRDQLKSRRPCERRPLWCSGQAPMALLDCASTERACEKQRRGNVTRGGVDFGPCRLMP